MMSKLITNNHQIFEEIRKHNINKVREYIDNNECDINIISKEGWTPLQWAIVKYDYRIAKYLIDKGADICTPDRWWKKTPLHYAARYGVDNIAKYLVERKVDIDAKDKDMNTPLHFAVEKNHVDIAIYLINEKADIECRNNYGLTPLLIAAERVFDYMFKILIDRGANVHASNRQGLSSIHIAANKSRTIMIQYLIDSNADVNALDNKGKSAFTTALINYVRYNQGFDTMELLLQHSYLTISDIRRLYIDDQGRRRFAFVNLMLERDVKRYLTFCELFSVGKKTIENGNDKQEENSLMVGYDPPLEEDKVRPFPPMFDSNSHESLFDATLVAEIWSFARDSLKGELVI